MNGTKISRINENDYYEIGKRKKVDMIRIIIEMNSLM
jgi:hypothetical protein